MGSATSLEFFQRRHLPLSVAGFVVELVNRGKSDTVVEIGKICRSRCVPNANTIEKLNDLVFQGWLDVGIF